MKANLKWVGSDLTFSYKQQMIYTLIHLRQPYMHDIFKLTYQFHHDSTS